MIKIKATTETEKTLKFLTEMPLEMTKAIRQGFYISGKQLVTDLNKDMKLPKSGRAYKVYSGVKGKLKKPKIHIASAPNETPAIITGKFRKSVDFAVRGNRTLEFGANENAPEYAKFLEEGTSKMEAREPFKKTVLKNKEKIKANVDNRLKKVIGGKK
jgi:HK97 gp10 family phage protein